MTLMELIIVSALMGLIMTIVFVTMMNSARIVTNLDIRAQRTDDAREVLDAVANDIRDARPLLTCLDRPEPLPGQPCRRTIEYTSLVNGISKSKLDAAVDDIDADADVRDALAGRASSQIILVAEERRVRFVVYPLKDTTGYATGVDGSLRAPQLVELTTACPGVCPSLPPNSPAGTVGLWINRYDPAVANDPYVTPSELSSYFQATPSLTSLIGYIENGGRSTDPPLFSYIVAGPTCSSPGYPVTRPDVVDATEMTNIMAVIIDPVFTWQEKEVRDPLIDPTKTFEGVDRLGATTSGTRVVAAIRAKNFQEERELENEC
jgi:type II secretory pathway pseudopilin PulG